MQSLPSSAESDAVRPWQFTLRRMFLWTAIVAVVCAVGVKIGWAFVVYLGVAFVIWSFAPSRQSAIIREILWLMFSASIFGALIPPVSSPIPKSHVCKNHIRELAFAVMMYEQGAHHLPPAYVTDKATGKPLYSWRVLILPHLDEMALYKKFHLDEPWNSPNNLPLLAKMPNIFECPSVPNSKPGMTNYVAMVGPQTVWPGAIGSKLAEITDQPEETLLLVELGGPGVPWTAPVDWDVSSLSKSQPPWVNGSLPTIHEGVIHVVTADGQVHTIQPDIELSDLKAILSRAGGEKVNIKQE